MLHTEYCNNFEVQHGLLRSESKKILKKVQQCLTNSDKNLLTNNRSISSRHQSGPAKQLFFVNGCQFGH